MKLIKLVLYAAGAVIIMAVVGTLAAPKLAATIRGAFVEVVIPSRPFYDSMSVLNSVVSVGPDTGTLGVSNITLINFDSTSQQVFIFAPIFSGGGCGSAVTGGSSPRMTVYVQPQQTLVIPYPSPLVFTGFSGHTCVAAEVTTVLHGGSVEVDVTGFVN
jgi:hypothetical protein